MILEIQFVPFYLRDNIVKIEGLSKIFNTSKHNEIRGVDNVSLTMKEEYSRFTAGTIRFRKNHTAFTYSLSQQAHIGNLCLFE